MKEIIYEFCEFTAYFMLTLILIGLIMAAVCYIKQKIEERRIIKAEALERYVQYRINRYIHKGY